MALPANIRLRRPSGSGEDAVLALVLLTACQIADTGRSDRELVDVEEEWAQEGVELERDAWIALDAGGDAIGYAFVHDGRAEVSVHPRARGLGLGNALREAAEARAVETRTPELMQVVAGGNRPAERLLENSGYVPVHHAWRMERPLDVAPAPPRWPSGVAMHELHGDGEAAEVLALLERSGATLPDGRPLALDRFHSEHLAPELLDPELCVLARQGDELVGVAICETWDECDGSIVQLAVDRPNRRRGIGHALLLAALGRLREHGLSTAVLHVGADQPTLPSVFADVGMRPVWRQTSWRKRLR
jgi:mycothiol synthase